jgi:dynein assembly factor 5
LKDETVDAILKQMLSTLDDENKLTRVYTCKILNIILINNNNKLTLDQLHKMYTEMIKRLDDNSEEIRLLMIDAFKSYFQNIKTHHFDKYDKVLYQAHLEAIYQGLIIHLDDPNPAIQENIRGIINFCVF